MDSRPIVTYAGDEKLFESLKANLTECLPQESIEWRRSHMRNPKPVYVTANFSPFLEKQLSKEGNKSLLGQAFFHTYWTECSDLDSYKQSTKDAINVWLTKLKSNKIYDWLIIVVDHVDNRKLNKTKLLPRTTVIDKIKNDFPSQDAQRCISFVDQSRNDARAAESWQLLLQRIRKLILQAYSRQLNQFEEHMRTQRERRNEPGWNFQDFFFLQEELAFILEMLGLYDEALVQYDELDALFTQFVINSNVGDMPEWLTNFTKDCDLWSGICLLRETSFVLRDVLKKGEACLLDLRNYLFSRQCSLLLLRCRPWEVAERSLPFLHNCISELKILEISMPVGSVACWVFLSSLEVLQTCEKFSDTSQIKAYSSYTAGLWAYAREKLDELGVLCGLMPDQEATSQQLHLVVSLLSGMGEDPYPDTGTPSPHAKLREALSSKDSFLKHYMELSELTMGTFKHNRRIRTARLIGRDLAQLYMKLKQPQKAVAFLSDLLKTYREENWEQLTIQTYQDLYECYREMNDTNRLLKTCIRLSSASSLSLETRHNYFQEVLRSSSKLDSEILLLRTEKIFLVDCAGIRSSDAPIISNSEVKISFSISSSLPQDIICRYIKILLKREVASNAEKSKSGPSGTHLCVSRGSSSVAQSPMSPMQSGGLGIPSREDMPTRLHTHPQLVTHSYYQSDGTLTCAVICKNTNQVVRRRDSQGFQKDKDISDEETGLNFKASNVKLIPGINIISITIKIPDPGLYIFNRLWMEWGNIHFVLSQLPHPFSFLVVEEPPAISLKSSTGDLLAGVVQKLALEVYSGSRSIVPGTVIVIKPSKDLQFKVGENNWQNSNEVSLPEVKPFQTIQLPLEVIAYFGPQKNENTIEHRVLLQSSLIPISCPINLHFQPPFLVSYKLHTCGIRKYIQVVIHGLTMKKFVFKNPQLIPVDKKSTELKPSNSTQDLIVNIEQTAYFLWEILHEDEKEPPNRFLFSVDYVPKDIESDVPHKFEFDFRLNNYETLYAVRARVEPPKGSEFCRAGILCFMHININQINLSVHTSLMYEVVADQTMWAVCGRTAGVVNIDNTGKHGVILDVMPLVGGFLPLPAVRLSKYIPAESQKANNKESIPAKDNGSYNVARLEPFDPGQVYSWSRAMQVHVLPGVNPPATEIVS